MGGRAPWGVRPAHPGRVRPRLCPKPRSGHPSTAGLVRPMNPDGTAADILGSSDANRPGSDRLRLPAVGAPGVGGRTNTKDSPGRHRSSSGQSPGGGTGLRWQPATTRRWCGATSRRFRWRRLDLAGRGPRTSLCRPHGSEGAVVGCPGLSEWFGCSTRHSDLMATVKESSRRTIEWPSGPGRGGSSAWIASTSSWTGDDRTTMSVRQGGAHARPANRLYTCIVSVTCVRSTERTIGHPRT
jgi:hypothetical protein